MKEKERRIPYRFESELNRIGESSKQRRNPIITFSIITFISGMFKIIYFRTPLIARIFFFLSLSMLPDYWSIFVIQCIMILDAVIFTLVLLLQTCHLFVYEVVSIKVTLVNNFQKGNLVPPPPPPPVRHRLNVIKNFFNPPTRGGAYLEQENIEDADFEEIPEAKKTTTEIPLAPHTFKKIEVGLWQVNNHQWGLREAKRNQSKYQTKLNNGKATHRDLRWLNYYNNVVNLMKEDFKKHEAEELKKAEETLAKSDTQTKDLF